MLERECCPADADLGSLHSQAGTGEIHNSRFHSDLVPNALGPGSRFSASPPGDGFALCSQSQECCREGLAHRWEPEKGQAKAKSTPLRGRHPPPPKRSGVSGRRRPAGGAVRRRPRGVV